MLKLVFYLIYIFFRKLSYKGDYFTFFLIVSFLLFSLSSIYQIYQKSWYLLFYFLLITIFHHFDRKDLSLLKINYNWRRIIFLEYFISNIPVIVIFCLKNDFLYAGLYILMLFAISFLPKKTNKLAFPFRLFDPFWHIVFRKYKLVITLFISFFLIVIGKIYNNENLAIFSIGFMTFVCCFPYFEREYLSHINISFFKGRKYLHQQIKTMIINYLLTLFLIKILIIVLFSWEIILFFPLFFIFPIIGILTKYAFFDNKILQSIIFIIILGGFSFALPFIALPFLYYKSVKNIKKIQNVTY